jgi:hypothetical protein
MDFEKRAHTALIPFAPIYSSRKELKSTTREQVLDL